MSSITYEGVTYTEGDEVEFEFHGNDGEDHTSRGPLESDGSRLIIRRGEPHRWEDEISGLDYLFVLIQGGGLGGGIRNLRKITDLRVGDKVRLVKRWSINGDHHATWDRFMDVGSVTEVASLDDGGEYIGLPVRGSVYYVDPDCLEKVTDEATPQPEDDLTVEQLRAKVAEMEQKLRTIGNDAIDLAQREGYCSAVERFLDEHGIPYGDEEVEVVVVVEHRVKGRLRSRRDLEALTSTSSYLARTLQTTPLSEVISEVIRIVDVEVSR